MVLALTIWTSGTCLLRYRTYRFPPLQSQPERPRGVRAVLLLAEGIKTELAASGIDPHMITNEQLNRHIYKSLKGGSTSFGFPRRNRRVYNRHILQWVIHNIGWIVIAIGLGTSSLYFGLALAKLSITFLMVFAILSAYLIGTTRKSRLFLAVLLALPTSFLLVFLLLIN